MIIDEHFKIDFRNGEMKMTFVHWARRQKNYSRSNSPMSNPSKDIQINASYRICRTSKYRTMM